MVKEALAWWNALLVSTKQRLSSEFFGNNNYSSLNNDDIFIIFKAKNEIIA